MPDTALGPVKVLEYAQFVAGPYCGKLMSDLGAEVIKIEPPDGDIARERGPFPNDVPHPEQSGLFLYLNTNKKGITINLESLKGRGIFKELVKEADILIEDTPPGKMRKMGLDYKALSKINPRLIVASVTPFGQTGPHKSYKATYLNLNHCSGLGYMCPMDTLDPDLLKREPTREAGFWGEYDAGMITGIAVLAALYSRRFSGKGQYIDISQQESQIHMQLGYMAGYFEDGHFTNRIDPKSFGAGPGFYRCKDGYVQIGASEERQWQGLMEMMGHPEWEKEEMFSLENRRKHPIEIYEHVAPWALAHTKEELFYGLQDRMCEAAPVNKVEDVARADYAKARGLFVDIDHPQAGKLSYVRGTGILSETPWIYKSAAPLLGQHNQEVYCDRLGYSPEQLAKLRGTGVI